MGINEKQVYKKYAYFRAILKFFSLDIEAEKTSVLVGISRPTINKFYKLFRERIVELCEAESPFENGEIELDESYFGARRVRGKRGRGDLEGLVSYLCKIMKINILQLNIIFLNIKRGWKRGCFIFLYLFYFVSL